MACSCASGITVMEGFQFDIYITPQVALYRPGLPMLTRQPLLTTGGTPSRHCLWCEH